MREYNTYERKGGRITVCGRNTSTNTTEEDIWDASQAWTPFTSAVTLDLSSTSANDTAAGTGARTVRIFGLDTNYRWQEETMTLNGQTAVVSAGSYIFVYGMEVATAGSGGVNAGILYLADSVVTQTGGVPSDLTKICAYVAAGENISHNGFFIPPADLDYGLEEVTFTNYGQVSRFRIYRRPFGGLWNLDREYALPAPGVLTMRYPVPIEIPAKSALRFAVISGVAGAIATVDAVLRRF